MKVTRQLLRDVGVCGPYVRAFSDAFPSETYPDGVELTRDVCVAHATEFDWSWAASEFLTWDGRVEYDRLRDSRAAANRQFGTGDARRAAVFGHLFETREDYRSPRVVELAQTADERADREVVRAVESARADVDEARRQLEYWTTRVPSVETRLAAREAEAATALRRLAVRKAEAQVAAVAEAEARLVELREAAAAATAELERLAAEAPETAAEPPAEPTLPEAAAALATAEAS